MTCPQDCVRVKPSASGSGFPRTELSFRPEYAQSDLPFSGALSEPAIHLPLPVISPANAEPEPTAAIATAQSAGATNLFSRIFLPPTALIYMCRRRVGAVAKTTRPVIPHAGPLRPRMGGAARRGTGGSDGNREDGRYAQRDLPGWVVPTTSTGR